MIFLNVLYNLGVIAAFTILSIHFDNKWFVLLALLFIQDITVKYKEN